MNQSVDATVQTDEDTEIGNRLDLTGDLVVAIERRAANSAQGLDLHCLTPSEMRRRSSSISSDHDFDFFSDLKRYVPD